MMPANWALQLSSPAGGCQQRQATLQKPTGSPLPAPTDQSHHRPSPLVTAGGCRRLPRGEALLYLCKSAPRTSRSVPSCLLDSQLLTLSTKGAGGEGGKTGGEAGE